MKSTTLNGILVALIIVLVGVIMVQDSNNNPAVAASDNEDGSRTVNSSGSGANGIITVAGQYSANSSIIYLVDTNREVILTYGCYGRGYSKPYLDFLCGRNYAWDAIYVQKKGIFGDTDRATPVQVKQRASE